MKTTKNVFFVVLFAALLLLATTSSASAVEEDVDFEREPQQTLDFEIDTDSDEGDFDGQEEDGNGKEDEDNEVDDDEDSETNISELPVIADVVEGRQFRNLEQAYRRLSRKFYAHDGEGDHPCARRRHRRHPLCARLRRRVCHHRRHRRHPVCRHHHRRHHRRHHHRHHRRHHHRHHRRHHHHHRRHHHHHHRHHRRHRCPPGAVHRFARTRSHCKCADNQYLSHNKRLCLCPTGFHQSKRNPRNCIRHCPANTVQKFVHYPANCQCSTGYSPASGAENGNDGCIQKVCPAHTVFNPVTGKCDQKDKRCPINSKAAWVPLGENCQCLDTHVMTCQSANMDCTCEKRTCPAGEHLNKAGTVCKKNPTRCPKHSVKAIVYGSADLCACRKGYLKGKDGKCHRPHRKHHPHHRRHHHRHHHRHHRRHHPHHRRHHRHHRRHHRHHRRHHPHHRKHHRHHRRHHRHHRRHHPHHRRHHRHHRRHHHRHHRRHHPHHRRHHRHHRRHHRHHRRHHPHHRRHHRHHRRHHHHHRRHHPHHRRHIQCEVGKALVNGKCVPVMHECPPHSKSWFVNRLAGETCACAEGFHYLNHQCVPIACPEPGQFRRNGVCVVRCPKNSVHAHAQSLSECVCHKGFFHRRGRCIKRCTKKKRHCPAGLQRFNGVCSRRCPPHSISSYVPAHGGRCVCNKGYVRKGRFCIKVRRLCKKRRYVPNKAGQCPGLSVLIHGRCRFQCPPNSIRDYARRPGGCRCQEGYLMKGRAPNNNCQRVREFECSEDAFFDKETGKCTPILKYCPSFAVKRYVNAEIGEECACPADRILINGVCLLVSGDDITGSSVSQATLNSTSSDTISTTLSSSISKRLASLQQLKVWHDLLKHSHHHHHLAGYLGRYAMLKVKEQEASAAAETTSNELAHNKLMQRVEELKREQSALARSIYKYHRSGRSDAERHEKKETLEMKTQDLFNWISSLKKKAAVELAVEISQN